MLSNRTNEVISLECDNFEYLGHQQPEEQISPETDLENLYRVVRGLQEVALAIYSTGASSRWYHPYCPQ